MTIWYKTAINAARDGFWVTDLKGNLLEANLAYARMSGYSIDELLKMHVTQLEAVDDLEKVNARIQQLMTEGHLLFESRHRHKDGHLIDVEVSVNHMADSQQIYAFFRDITDRLKIQKRTEMHLKRYQTVMKNALDGIHVMDMYGNLVEFNESFCTMLGYTQEEAQSLNIADWNAQWTKQELMKKFVALSGKSARFETVHKRKDGALIDVEVSTTGVEINGELFLFASSRDISNRKKIESELRIASVAFESQESIMITDARGVILRVNQAFVDSTGYAVNEVVGKTPKLLKSGRHDAEFYREMWETINLTGSWQGEIWDRRKGGEIYPKLLTISTVRSESGAVTHYVGSHIDITERKLSEEKIQNLAFYDPLTNLPNRRLLVDRLQHALATSARNTKSGALLFIDLDNFKVLNDTIGHAIGDLLLQQVAHRLTSCIRECDTVARLGGDEFVVMLEDLSEQPLESAAQTESIGEKILTTLRQPYRLGTHECRSSSSVGATLFRGHQQPLEELLKQADIAMYQAKKEGRNTLRFFDPQMQASINDMALLEEELREALDNQQFQLYFQIQVDSTHCALGAEALIRWVHPQRGTISPQKFIPLAEETGLILQIGQWVLEAACAQIKKVQSAVRRHAINPMLLSFELTESMMLRDIESTVKTMNALRKIGVLFSLDDFGTGYSSLQYLKRLPLNQLKIDGSFVRDITRNSSDKAIVRTIISMAQSLNLGVIAEGVETDEQKQLLVDNGCTRFQGHLFSQAVPIEQFNGLLNRITQL
jgi:diguanylate cyclase (GGDEF)-like protein/PAS domain S-box-containing protein